MSKDCIFCKIVDGQIPAACVYEDDLFKVILDNAPSAPGHALIIAKRHADTLSDLDHESAKALFPVTQTIAQAIKQAVKADGVNILQNNGEAAGQTVNHLHVHVIPRYHNDLVDILWEHQQVTAEQLQATAAHIQTKLQED